MASQRMQENVFRSNVSKHSGASSLEQQLSLPLNSGHLRGIDAAEFDVVANIQLPAHLLIVKDADSSGSGSDSGTSSPCAGPSQCQYVGVDKVPGKTRWPYRAVLSLPTLTTGSSCQDPILCESYYSTPEAAARAVDALCIVLLGRHAAVNFPASSYDTADLEDALSYIRCVSGGGGSPGACCRVGHGMDLKRSARVAFTTSGTGFSSGSSSTWESEDSMMMD